VNLDVAGITKEVDVIAISRSGKMTEVKRKIQVQ
jgi:hypothetical protein